eukprot:3829303-Rhodomonas_salina.4
MLATSGTGVGYMLLWHPLVLTSAMVLQHPQGAESPVHHPLVRGRGRPVPQVPHHAGTASSILLRPGLVLT